MTWRERADFQPQDAFQRRQQQIDIAVNKAQQIQRVPLSELEQDGVYLVHNAWAKLEPLGDFVEETARAAIDDIRSTWGIGVQLTNVLKKVFSDECADEWTVIFETALPALLAALKLFLTPSPGEILENYLEPKALKSSGRGPADTKNKRRKKGRRNRLRKQFPRIPDVDRLIADRLPGRQAVEGRRATTLTRWTFTGINVADRFLWWALVYEAGDTFISTWLSGLQEARFCSGTATSIFIDTKTLVDQGTLTPFPATEDATIINFVAFAGTRAGWRTNDDTSYEAGSGSVSLEFSIQKTDGFAWQDQLTVGITIHNAVGNIILTVSDRGDMDQSDSISISLTADPTGGYSFSSFISFDNPNLSYPPRSWTHNASVNP